MLQAGWSLVTQVRNGLGLGLGLGEEWGGGGKGLKVLGGLA